MWTSSKIRQAFLDYFAANGHAIVDSSSLVPVNDPTLLFTNAGMNQFKDVFLGIEKRNYVRAASSQKCVRAGGKHNDLDTVGRTARHHTFFEMLGNFSFGDYFKREAIHYAWEFLTSVVGLPKDKLWITIYLDDDEANELWQEVAGVKPERILRLGEKDNFWAMGDTGPCGPCSEVHYDRGAEYACGPDCGLGKCDCDRYLEIWNLVFMQFNRSESGEMSPLPRPSIDTGMGLERISSLMMGYDNNWETDLFRPIIAWIEELAGHSYDKGDKGFPFRVIADHIRTCTFLIADGVLPSNDGRGYVLRRILRRAVRFGQFLGLTQPFMYKAVDVVCELMKDAYPYLVEKQDFVKQVIKHEEERFFITLTEGVKKASEIIERTIACGEQTLAGSDAFTLYDTYGFPLDLTEDMAEEHGLGVDKEGFAAMMEVQRERAREANKGLCAFAEETFYAEILDAIPATEFRGYQDRELRPLVEAIIVDGQPVDYAADTRAFLVFRETPFYAESGGQVSDTGRGSSSNGGVEIEHARKYGNWIVHQAQISGSLSVGEPISLCIDDRQRTDTARNHTATHLLHMALRKVLGEHAQQKGSLVEPGRLRFDFAHLAAVTGEELQRIEDIVNEAIMADYEVGTAEKSLQEAREDGATALFGEKYGEKVRVVAIEDISMELCGGTHVERTGQIGLFKITSESSIGAGLRRIEALTGKPALDYMRSNQAIVDGLSGLLKAAPADLIGRVDALNQGLKERDKEVELLKNRLASQGFDTVLAQAEQLGKTSLLVTRFDGQDMNQLRQNAEKMRDKLGNAVVLLASVAEDKVALVCFVSKSLVEQGFNAGQIVGQAARATGGGGGGRADMAQAGGKDPSRLDAALEEARGELRARLA